jgi:pimeloyl-ACP methyl ester carboxylesterase
MSHADVNGVSLYYEEHGSGEPLVLLHGGIGAGEMFEPIVPALAAGRRVITVDLQGHGGTADVDRPLRPETMADDVAALIEHLGLERADLMGYSLGGYVALRTAIQHPERVRRLVLVSVTFSRDGSHPEVVQSMDQFSPELAPMLQQSPLYETYARLAPRVEDWPVLIAKTADLLHADYDWRAEAAQLQPAVCATPTGTARCARPRGWPSCRARRTTTSTPRPRSRRRPSASSTRSSRPRPAAGPPSRPSPAPAG